LVILGFLYFRDSPDNIRLSYEKRMERNSRVEPDFLRASIFVARRR